MKKRDAFKTEAKNMTLANRNLDEVEEVWAKFRALRNKNK